MRFTGIVRNVDDLGRIVIPKEMRDRLGMLEGTPVEFWEEDGNVVLKPYRLSCVICGGMDEVVELRDERWPNNPVGRGICMHCAGRAMREYEVQKAAEASGGGEDD